MTDSEFLDRAEEAFKWIESSCDRLNENGGVDIDNQRSGAMLTLAFGNKSQIVVNLQKPLHEIWLAAKSGGYHFRYESGVWKDTKGAGELLATLSGCATEQAGMKLSFEKTFSS